MRRRARRACRTTSGRPSAPARFRVDRPPAPLVPAAAILGAAVLPTPNPGVGALLGARQPAPGFSLPPAGPNVQALTIFTPPSVVTITFGAGIANPAAATQAE